MTNSRGAGPFWTARSNVDEAKTVTRDVCAHKSLGQMSSGVHNKAGVRDNPVTETFL